MLETSVLNRESHFFSKVSFNSILKTLSNFNIPFVLPLKDKKRRYSIGDKFVIVC